MKHLKLSMLMFALLWFIQSGATQASILPLSDADFSIGNITINSIYNELEVTHTFGSPVEIHMIGPAGGAMYNKQLTYQDVIIQISAKAETTPSYVREIHLNTANYSTARNLRVGDSIAKIKNAYPSLPDWNPYSGKSRPLNGFISTGATSTGYYIAYVSNQNNMIRFNLNHSNIIIKIELASWMP